MVIFLTKNIPDLEEEKPLSHFRRIAGLSLKQKRKTYHKTDTQKHSKLKLKMLRECVPSKQVTYTNSMYHWEVICFNFTIFWTTTTKQINKTKKQTLSYLSIHSIYHHYIGQDKVLKLINTCKTVGKKRTEKRKYLVKKKLQQYTRKRKEEKAKNGQNKINI